MNNCNTSKFKSKMLSDLQERTSSIEIYGKAFISIMGRFFLKGPHFATSTSPKTNLIELRKYAKFSTFLGK